MFLFLMFIIVCALVLAFNWYVDFIIKNADLLNEYDKTIKEIPEIKQPYKPSRSAMRPKYTKGSRKVSKQTKFVKTTSYKV